MVPAAKTQATFQERLTAAAVFGVALLLRIPYIFHYRFSSDEPQHLHVAWGWARGLVQYRDLFDNHPAATRSCVATVDDERFTDRSRVFLDENHVPVGHQRVVGTLLGEPAANRTLLDFTVTIPASYAVVAKGGTVGGLLDGTPHTGPRQLSEGRHEFVPGGPAGRLAVVWAKAVERDFPPSRTGEAPR